MSERIVKRAVFDPDVAVKISNLVKKLRADGARTDTSKTVNAIIRRYFSKASQKDYKALQKEFFDKKGYLKDIIQQASQQELEAIVTKYLKQTKQHSSDE